MLQEIQRHALAFEQRARRPAYRGQSLSIMDAGSAESLDLDAFHAAGCLLDQGKNLVPRHHLLLARQEPPARHVSFGNAGVRSNVARPDVFFKRALDTVDDVRMREIDHEEDPLSAFRTLASWVW